MTKKYGDITDITIPIRHNALVSRLLTIRRIFILLRRMNVPFQISYKNEEIEVLQGTLDDIYKFEKDMDYQSEKDYLYGRERFEKGDLFIKACIGDEVVGYCWSMQKEMELPFGQYLRLGSEFFYTYKNYVKPEFRGKRILNIMDKYFFDYYRKIGKKFWITLVFENNKPALKNRWRSDFKCIGSILIFSGFGIKKYYIKRDIQNLLQRER